MNDILRKFNEFTLELENLKKEDINLDKACDLMKKKVDLMNEVIALKKQNPDEEIPDILLDVIDKNTELMNNLL